MKAFLALYYGSYGKTIRIEIRDKSALKQLYETTYMLGTGVKELVRIDGHEDKRCNVKEMVLKTGLKEEISVAGQLNDNDITITWCRDKESWCYVRDLIDALLAADYPCEQHIESDKYFIEIEWKPDIGII